jgi:NADH:quinone reductase (non-electrogenic)
MAPEGRQVPGQRASDARPRVVIVGGGFGGLHAAKALRSAPVEIVLVDRRNHHLFQPLLYQVATAGLSGVDVARPIRAILRRQRNTTVLLGEVAEVCAAEQRVRLSDGEEIPFDFLILAAGLTSSYFGHEEWKRHAPALKTLSDAFEMRRRMLLAFEAAERESDPARRAAWLTFVVVGGGPTGVELAGALREIALETMARDFRRAEPRQTRVILVEGEPRLLPSFPERLSERARQMLESSGVEVRTARRITSIDEGGVSVGEERIESRTVLWAAGVRAVDVARSLGAPSTRDGRVLVERDLTVPGHPRIQVIGDLAALRRSDVPGEEWVPGMAPAAIQEGLHAAKNILRILRGEETAPFVYRDKGVLATIGRAKAVARVGRLEFAGRFAWLVWLVVHITWLIGFRNRLVVLIDWAWSYLTFQRNARIVDDLGFPPDALGAGQRTTAAPTTPARERSSAP